MNGAAARFAAAAESLVGTPFRLHGRDPERGLDCVGVVIAALQAIDHPCRSPTGYRLRNLDIGPWLGFAPLCGLVEVTSSISIGDILLTETGPAQFHLLIAAPNGRFIHAHSGLRRVVTTPASICWPLRRHWRLAPD